jgi:hypothetical protein
MEPELGCEEYIFATFPAAVYGDLAPLAPVASIREREGMTLVIERTVAEAAEVSFEAVFRRISLKVHSSLQAAGLTAAITGVLNEKGISANVIAGYFHDHIFVPSQSAEAALQALKDLSGAC